MRIKSMNFEQLVQHNKNEILKDKKRISEIEQRWEKKQEDVVQERKDVF